MQNRSLVPCDFEVYAVVGAREQFQENAGGRVQDPRGRREQDKNGVVDRGGMEDIGFWAFIVWRGGSPYGGAIARQLDNYFRVEQRVVHEHNRDTEGRIADG